MKFFRFVLVITLCLGGGAPRAQDNVFEDGFESQLPDCLGGALGGETLSPPSLRQAELLGCFEISNDAAGRVDELAFGSLPLSRAAAVADADLQRLVVIGPGGQRRPADFHVLSRWGAPLAATTAPIRWLQTALAVNMVAGASATLALMRLPAPAAAVADPGAIQVSVLGAQRRLIDTGAAEFEIDAALSQPIRRIRIRDGRDGSLTEIFAAQPGSADEGLAIRVREPGGSLILDAAESVPGSLVVDAVRWQADAASVRAEVHIDGHLASAGSGHLCQGDPAWQRFPYSLTLGFHRGSAAIQIDAQLGNACGTPQSAPDDALVEFEFAAFRLPLARGVEPQTQALVATIGNPQAFSSGSGSVFRVSQHRGSGIPWQRRADLTEDGNVLDSNGFFLQPAVGLIRPLAGDARLVALATMPWMRYREPQALQVESGRLSLALIAEPSLVGKAKSLWFAGRIELRVSASASQSLDLATSMRSSLHFAAERALTVRPTPASLDAAALQPPLAGSLATAPGGAYLQYLQLKHLATVGDEPCTDAGNDAGSQWTCAKTFGLQVWPDIQFNEQFGFTENADPESNEVRLNYWDPALIELTEFQRSGQPRWLWEFALPQSRLMSYTAYYHFGRFPNGAGANSNIAGHSFGSGGNGEGLWHRSGAGSADYTYNRHQAVAHVLRPSIAQHDRFAAAGHAASLRFSNDRNDDTTWAAIGRLNLQYIESLANCAQFVHGSAGINCDTRLREVLTHLIENSLSAGLMCELKLEPGADCFVGQNFMLYAWFYPILERLFLNYGESLSPALAQSWRHALSITPAQLLASLPTTGNGDIDVDASWPNGVFCQLSGAGFSQIDRCTPVPDPDNLSQNKLAMLSLLARGHANDPALGLCAAVQQIGTDLFQDGSALSVLQAVVRGGWWKGAVESAQSLSTAVLGFERCALTGSAR